MRLLEDLFFQRPRILNFLHYFGLVRPTSQTSVEERDTLARYSLGCETAVEIGTYQGLSSVYIANSLLPSGKLWCVDPWPSAHGVSNPGLSICRRHFKRSGIMSRIVIVRDYSSNVGGTLPKIVDFAFIDGDHSWSGIECDWNLMAGRIRSGGYICLHDSVAPHDDPLRAHDSIRFFNEVVQCDSRFETVELVYSLAVLRRL
jgi:predicted O-methyltransferase YrrM